MFEQKGLNTVKHYNSEKPGKRKMKRQMETLPNPAKSVKY